MTKLVINTTISSLIVALDRNGKIFSRQEDNVKKHNEMLLSKIDEVLTDAKISLDDVDEFGVVTGPGSFTGIRIGIATIKAFRDAKNKPARGINNLKILLKIASKHGINIVAIAGSPNSFFVAESGENERIYPHLLSYAELKNLAGERIVGVFEKTPPMEEMDIHFEVLKYDVSAMMSCFDESTDEKLVPVYYQLSQAEHDKLSKMKISTELNNEKKRQVLAIEEKNFSKDVTGDAPWTEQIFDEMLADSNYIFYFAEIDDNIVGYIVGVETDEVNISRVAVESSLQNNGIATKLIEKLSDYAKSNGKNLSLEVSEHNETAIRLYKKLGFVMRRVRKNYYKDGSSCFEMIKTLV